MLSHTSFYEEEFSPVKKVGVSGYRAPKHVWLDPGGVPGGMLMWESEGAGEGQRIVRPTARTFEEFVSLREGTNGDILKYAKRWGVLGLCKRHGWPTSHDPNCLSRTFGSSDAIMGESLKSWIIFAEVAAAILEISQKLDDGELGDQEDWEVMLQMYRWPPALQMDWHTPGYSWATAKRKQAAAVEKTAIASLINHWLVLGSVRPHVLWFDNEKNLGVSLLTRGLFSALAVQLMERAGRYVLAACSECRKFYRPTRRPKATQNRYCPDCTAAGIPLLRASQWRNQRKQGLQKQRRGKSWQDN